MEKTLNQKIYEVPLDIKQAIYDRGYEAGKNMMLSEIADVLEECANDNAGMIVNALKELKKKYGMQ